jgi:hypothetical protein
LCVAFASDESTLGFLRFWLGLGVISLCFSFPLCWVLYLIQLARVSSSFWWAFMINCAAKPALAYSLIDQLRRDFCVCITIIKHELARSKIKELVLVFFFSGEFSQRGEKNKSTANW